jgi:hypothetical protein
MQQAQKQKKMKKIEPGLHCRRNDFRLQASAQLLILLTRGWTNNASTKLSPSPLPPPPPRSRSTMDSPFQVSECRTTSPQHDDSSSLSPAQPLAYPDTPSANPTNPTHLSTDYQLFASPSPILYRCSPSFTPVSALPPWSPFRTPFELSLSFHSPPNFVQSISPIIRYDSQQRSCSSSSTSTPFVQRLLSVRPPSSSPPSIVSLSSDLAGPSTHFDSPLSSPLSSQDGDEFDSRSSFTDSIADKVKRTRRVAPSSPSLSVQTIPERMYADTTPAKRKADFIDEGSHNRSKIARQKKVENDEKPATFLRENRPDEFTTYNSSDYPIHIYPCRTFSPKIPLHSDFPLFYRRFPVSSYQASKYDISYILQLCQCSSSSAPQKFLAQLLICLAAISISILHVLSKALEERNSVCALSVWNPVVGAVKVKKCGSPQNFVSFPEALA